MIIHKTVIKKITHTGSVLFIFSFAASVLLVGHVLAAAADPGCYQQVQGSDSYTLDNNQCTGKNDSTGSPINPAATCYLQIIGATGPVGNYKSVDCSSIDSNKVSAGCGMATCLPQDPCNPSSTPQTGTTGGTPAKCQDIGAFRAYLDAALTFLAIGVGVIIAITIAVGGVQYITAGGDPQGVAAAKKRITNAIIALLAFVFIYAFLQFIVPGGTFR